MEKTPAARLGQYIVYPVLSWQYCVRHVENEAVILKQLTSRQKFTKNT